MITLYAACLRRLGLSQEEAETIHGRYGQAVRGDTIKSWSSGRRDPPLGVFEDLRRFAAEQRAILGGQPIDVAEAILLAEHVSPGRADETGMPGVNTMMTAIASRLLEGST